MQASEGALGKRLARSAVALLVAVSGLVALSVAQRQPVQAAGGFEKGAVADITWAIPHADIDRTISAMSAAGVRWVRANVQWAELEKSKGSFDSWWLDEVDYAVSKAQAAGIQVLMPFADGVPYWASADPAKSGGNRWNKYWRPTNFQDYADFVRAMVTRYQAKGVHAYEIWNEPNYVRFWPSGPNASDYVAMLRAAYPAVKAADPSSTVVTGGLSTNDYAFVTAMYQAGAKDNFDALAVHPYTGSVDPTTCWNDSGTTKPSQYALCGIESVRNVMVANGDSAKTMWLTEMGWSTSTASPGVSEATQADFLTKAFGKLQSYPYVKTAFWYSVRNLYWANDNPADVENGYGLLRTNFSEKPSYAAFKNVTPTVAQPASLSATPSSVQAGNPLSVTWANIAAPSAYDWIGLYPVGAADDSPTRATFRFTTGAASGNNLPLAVPAATPAGTYELRLFSNNSYTKLANAGPFVVTAAPAAPAATLSATPSSVPAGNSLSVTWSNIAAPATYDWIGLYPVGAADDSPTRATFRFTNGAAGGTLPMAVPAATPAGSYELRLFANNSYVKLANAGPFVVTGAPAPTLSATPSSVKAGKSLSVTWANITAPSTYDWIGLYPVGAADSSPTRTTFRFTTGATSGNVPLTVPAGTPAGAYELRLFSNNSYVKLANAGPFTIS